MKGITNTSFEANGTIEPPPDYENGYIDHRGEAYCIKRFVQPTEDADTDGKSKEHYCFRTYIRKHCFPKTQRSFYLSNLILGLYTP